MIRLAFVQDDFKEILEIDGDYIEIGRSRRAIIRVKDSAVSGEHCYLMRLGDRWMVVDLNSRNGTFLNGKRVTKERFNPGDTLGVGRARILFERELTPGSAPPSDPTGRDVRRLVSGPPPGPERRIEENGGTETGEDTGTLGP